MIERLEYIWLDGTSPVKQLRSKVRYIEFNDINGYIIPNWGFDGSSTNQASGHQSDLILRPVGSFNNPIEGGRLVLCEVLNDNATPHSTNTRHKLATLNEKFKDQGPIMGFEQEYTLIGEGSKPLGFHYFYPTKPQGPYYCSVGAENAFGREIVEEHATACLNARLLLYGTNAEVMPGQWEYQIGYRNTKENADPLEVSDHLWVARFLMQKIAEKHGVTASLDCKPMKGDWNGSGCHTNFSTEAMRTPVTGINAIHSAIGKLSLKHSEHIAVYGYGLEERLTGKHETCSINEFKSGIGHRGASIRIPGSVAADGHGYLEDRRPGANCDPYEVAAKLLETICE